LGWIKGDTAELSVAIRTFWNHKDGQLRFGTGAGITWGSEPSAEWEETQLKARKLISIAGGVL
jgi:para-aminobenzoate synthetase component 1